MGVDGNFRPMVNPLMQGPILGLYATPRTNGTAQRTFRVQVTYLCAVSPLISVEAVLLVSVNTFIYFLLYIFIILTFMSISIYSSTLWCIVMLIFEYFYITLIYFPVSSLIYSESHVFDDIFAIFVWSYLYIFTLILFIHDVYIFPQLFWILFLFLCAIFYITPYKFCLICCYTIFCVVFACVFGFDYILLWHYSHLAFGFRSSSFYFGLYFICSWSSFACFVVIYLRKFVF